ncbi:MAG: hypothetical protein AABW48_05410 [Nanoarchaeota archaeon]
MNKNGALDLSINMLIIVIISIVILSSGIVLMYQFISGAEEIKTSLDQKTNEELERLLVNQGERVALPLHIADVSRGDTHIFGLGILNTLGINQEFLITIELRRVSDETEHEITDKINKAEVQEWLLYNSQPIFIAEGNNVKEPILVSVPKNVVTGQYIFIAKVRTALGNDYGNPQQFYVNVR